jgi:hypothetical protein
MIVAVKQECLNNPETLRRIKMLEILGDGIILLAEGDLDQAYEMMDYVGVDWMVIHEEQAVGWDILFESGWKGEGRDVRGLFGEAISYT